MATCRVIAQQPGGSDAFSVTSLPFLPPIMWWDAAPGGLTFEPCSGRTMMEACQVPWKRRFALCFAHAQATRHMAWRLLGRAAWIETPSTSGPTRRKISILHCMASYAYPGTSSPARAVLLRAVPPVVGLGVWTRMGAPVGLASPQLPPVLPFPWPSDLCCLLSSRQETHFSFCCWLCFSGCPC